MNKLDNRPFLLKQTVSNGSVELVTHQPARVLPKTGSPVPYDDYAEKLQADVELIRQDWTKGQARVMMLIAIPPFVILALTVATTLFGETDSLVYWFGKGLLLLLIAFAGVKFIFQRKRTARSIIGHSYTERHLTCPHCSNAIDLTQPWHCGWCGVLSNEGMLLSPTLVFDGCSHKGRHRPTAVRCSHCHQDIIRDNPTYESECLTNSQGIGGIAEFVTPAER